MPSLLNAVSAVCVAATFTTALRDDIEYFNIESMPAEETVCNVFDDTSYCQRVVLSRTLHARPVETGCTCPRDWYCPTDPFATVFEEKCHYSPAERNWHCMMRCVPDASFKSYRHAFR